MDCNYDSEKLLSEAISCGILDLEDLRKKIAEVNRQKILTEIHQNKLWQTKSKSKDKCYTYWCTYLPDETSSRGIRKIKRSTKEALEDAIVDFYSGKLPENKPKIKTFKQTFEKWIEFKKSIVSDNTIYRYIEDYKRFFADTEFERLNIKDINEENIIVFLSDTVKRLNLTQKALKTLSGYVNECLESARANRLINSNPYLFAKPKLKLLYKLCVVNKPKNAEAETISQKDMKALLEQFEKDHINKPWYIAPYAVEFAMLSGCRIGEIAALRWSDIEDGIITIRHSEKSHRVLGQSITYTVETTKTGKERKIPVTKAIDDLLKRVSDAEDKLGYKGEFVFSNEKGRLLSVNIANCIRRKCKQVGIDRKSIHSCRKTVNSTLKCLGVSTPMAASMMGHTPEVNDNYYTYDVSELEKKREFLEKANMLMAE